MNIQNEFGISVTSFSAIVSIGTHNRSFLEYVQEIRERGLLFLWRPELIHPEIRNCLLIGFSLWAFAQLLSGLYMGTHKAYPSATWYSTHFKLDQIVVLYD